MAHNRKQVVQLWLPLVPAAVALLLMALVLWQVDRIVGRELEERSRQRVTQTATLFADRLSRLLERRTAELEMLAGMPALGVSLEDWRGQINRLKHGSSSYVWIGATNAEGTVIAGSDGLLEGVSIAQRPVFEQGIQGPWFGSLHPPVALREPLALRQLPVPRELADLAMPYRNAQGERGVLAAHLDAGFLDQLRTESIGPVLAQRGIQTELIDGQGVRLLGERLPLSSGGTRQLAALAPGVPTLFRGMDGRDYVVARVGVRPADNRLQVDWQVVTSQPLDQVLAPVTALREALLWSGGGLALLLGVAGFWLSRRLGQPYGELIDAVAERVGPEAAREPGELLRVIAEQLRRLPAAGAGSRTEQALAQVLQDASRLQAVFDHLPAPVYLMDMALRVTYWNRAAEITFGWSAAEARGRHIFDLLVERVPDPGRAAFRREVATQPGPWTFQTNMVGRDGGDIWGEWRITKLFGADGAPIGVLAQVDDFTPERLGELRLREQGEELTALIGAASDAVISVDLRGRITLFNPAAARIFQREAHSMLGQPLDALLPAGMWARHLGHMQRFAESNTTNRRMGIGRVQGMRADGRVLELEASISQATVRGGKRLTAILRDITERVSNEQALARYQLELSELTQRLLQQEQATTRELAQTLHDQLGQTLGAIRLSYDALATMVREQIPPQALERARTVGQQIDQAVAEVRQALVRLRPPLLESAGLVAALDNEIRQRAPEADPTQLELVNAAPQAGQRWPDGVEYAAFMVAREAIANALQHARASHVLVRVDGDDAHLRLDIADDGIGLSEDMALGRPGHLGMVGMRERALAIGARLRARAPRGRHTHHADLDGASGRRHQRHARDRARTQHPVLNRGTPMSDIYLVDDHAMMRDGLRAVLEGAGHHVVGEADNPTQALADIARLVPTVVLLDLHLGERSGFELLEQIAKRKLTTRVIMLTMSAQPRHVAEAMRQGAHGYVLKGSPAREVLQAVEAVAAGRKHLGGEVAQLAVEGLTQVEGTTGLESLSVRERQVIQLVVQGHTSVAIGETLHLSPKTVESYRSRLMAKLGVSDLPALVRLAIREGLISADDL